MSSFEKTEIVPNRHHSARGTVLLVEPDDVLRETARQALGEAGFLVVTARSGVQVLSSGLKEKVEVIVSRLEMEPIDGIALLKSVRIDQSYMPCVMTTRNMSPLARESTKEARIQRLLPLPVDSRTLIPAVTEALVLGRLMRARKDAGAGAAAEPRISPAGSAIRLHLSPIVAILSGKRFAVEAKISGDRLRFDPNGFARRIRDLVADRMHEVDPSCKVAVPITVSDATFELVHISSLGRYADRIILTLQADHELDTHPKIAAALGLLQRNGFQIMVDGLGADVGMFLRIARLRPRYLRFDMGVFRLAPAAQERTLSSLTEYCRSASMKMVVDDVKSKVDAATAQDYGIDFMQGPFVGS